MEKGTEDFLATKETPASVSTSNLHLTLKAWPVIAIATIGLCYLTQVVASWFGITLPDQQNIDIVRRYAGWNRTFVLLCLQILVLLPALEELVFRWLLFRLPTRLIGKMTERTGEPRESNDCPASRSPLDSPVSAKPFVVAGASAALFSAAHYIAQPWPDAAFIALFFFGLAQCWLYGKTDRLWCAILNHALFNLTNLILLFVIPQG